LKNIFKIREAIFIRNEFKRNIWITTFGNSVGYLIGFLFTPFIARVYLPDAYGAFAIFNSIAINLTLFTTLNYNNAIILPKSDNEVIRLLQLILILLFLNFCINYILVIFGGQLFVKFLKLDQIGSWIYFIPLIVFFSGINQSFIALANRLKDFRDFSKSKIISIGISKSYTLGYGYLFSGRLSGLIMGEFLIKVINIVLIVSNRSRAILNKILHFNIQEILQVAKIYKNYPIYYLPASWFLILINQIPLYFFTKYYGASNAGYFAFALSILNIPVLFFSNSISAVFIQKASTYYPENMGKLRAVSIDLIRVLVLFSSFAFGLIFGFGDIIFRLLLGDNWTNAGHFASFLSLGFVFYFISIPFNTLFRILKKERQFLIINLSFFIIILVTFIMLIDSRIEYILLIYSIEYGIYSLMILTYIGFQLSFGSSYAVLIKSMAIILTTFILFYLLRYIIDMLQ